MFSPTPLSESTLLILLSLASGPKHGYAIIQEVETLSSRRLRLSTGTLFGALKRLLADEWIETVDEQYSQRNRKCYRLTPTGRTMLLTEVRRLRTLVALAQTQMGMHSERADDPS